MARRTRRKAKARKLIPRAGRHYVLRNGAIVMVDRQLLLGHGTVRVLQGHFLGTSQTTTWGLDGMYSPLAGVTNGLDIVKAMGRTR